MNIPLTAPQNEFAFSGSPFPAFIGGFGAGKSQAGTIRLCHLMTMNAGIDVSHFFPTYRLAKRRGLAGTVSHIRNLGLTPTVNKSDLTVYVEELGSTIYLETYSDPDAIVAFEVGHAIVDELDTLPIEQARIVWQKVNERVRQTVTHEAGNTVGCVTTPDQGTAGFCYETWGNGERLDEGYHYTKAGTRTNKFLPDGYADQIAKNYDPVMAEAFLGGGWVSFTRNKVYSFFSREKHHDFRLITEGDALHVGIDFNIGGCCCTVWVVDNLRPVAVGEFVAVDTYGIINQLAANYKGHRITLYPDASGGNSTTNAAQSDIQLLEGAGFLVDAPASNPAIRDRINSFNALFAHNRIGINTLECPRLTNALELQGYSDKGANKGKPEKFDIHPAIDDWVDGSGYFINRMFPISKPVIFTGIGSAN